MCFRTYPYIPQPGFGIPQADLIVSELLGSFADNELSPECLDGAGAMGGTCGTWSFFGAENDLKMWVIWVNGRFMWAGEWTMIMLPLGY